MGTLKAKVAGVWTPVTGNPQSAADLSRWNSAWGVLGSAQVTSTFTTTGTHSTAQSTGLSVTVTETAGRRLSVRVQTNPYPSGGLNAMIYTLQRNGVTVQTWFVASEAMAVGASVAMVRTIPVAATGGTATYSVLLNGTGNTAVSDYGDNNSPRMISVEDAGPTILAAIAPPAASPRVVASGNALGVIAVGSFPAPLAPMSIPAASDSVITNPLVFFASVGRRYRINFQVRAITHQGTVGNGSFFLRDNGNGYRGWQPGGDPYVYVTGNYSSANFQWGMEGDNLQHSLDVACSSTVALSLFRDYGIFNVEDIGPNSYPALPIPETPPPWTPVGAFQNGWTNFLSGRAPTSYRKIGDVVDLRVAVKSGTIGAVVFQLPVGFRPPYVMDYVGRDSGTTGITIWNVQADGNVLVYGTQALNPFMGFTGSFSTTA